MVRRREEDSWEEEDDFWIETPAPTIAPESRRRLSETLGRDFTLAFDVMETIRRRNANAERRRTTPAPATYSIQANGLTTIDTLPGRYGQLTDSTDCPGGVLPCARLDDMYPDGRYELLHPFRGINSAGMVLRIWQFDASGTQISNSVGMGVPYTPSPAGDDFKAVLGVTIGVIALAACACIGIGTMKGTPAFMEPGVANLEETSM